MIKVTKHKRKLSRYVGVAALSAATDWFVFTILFFFGGAPLLAQGLARLGGGVASFTANKVFTFECKDRGKTASQARRFLILYALSYALSIALMYLGLKALDITPYLIKLFVDLTCFLFNYVMMDRFVFASTLTEKEDVASEF